VPDHGAAQSQIGSLAAGRRATAQLLCAYLSIRQGHYSKRRLGDRMHWAKLINEMERLTLKEDIRLADFLLEAEGTNMSISTIDQVL
jgi:hypothetical protein